MNAEDQRKIHASITQIDNQRAVLSTLAITVFGTFAGWWVAKAPQLGNDSHLSYIFPMILTTFLFLIYFYSFCLKRMLRTFTTYLIVKNASDWELDMRAYRKECHSDVEWHERAQATLFLTLGLGAAAFPFIVAPHKVRLFWIVCHLSIVVLYAVFVVGAGFFNWLDHEQEA